MHSYNASDNVIKSKAESQSNNFIKIACVRQLAGIDIIQVLQCFLYHMINTSVLRILQD